MFGHVAICQNDESLASETTTVDGEEYRLFDNPDDNNDGCCQYYDFREFGFGEVDVTSINFLDVGDNANVGTAVRITCLDSSGNVNEVADTSGGITGDGQSGIVYTPECEDTTVMEVCYTDSGAIDDIKVLIDQSDCPEKDKDGYFLYRGNWRTSDAASEEPMSLQFCSSRAITLFVPQV